jgi:uncharacterized membrane protein
MLSTLKAFLSSWKWLIIGALPFVPYALLQQLTPHHQLITILDDAVKQSEAQQTRYLIMVGVVLGIVALMIAFALIDLFDKDRMREVFIFAIWISFVLWMLTSATEEYLNVQFDESRVNVVNAPIADSFVDRSRGRRGGDIYTGYVRVQIPNSEQVVTFAARKNLPSYSYTPPAQVSFVYGKGYLEYSYVQNTREEN